MGLWKWSLCWGFWNGELQRRRLRFEGNKRYQGEFVGQLWVWVGGELSVWTVCGVEGPGSGDRCLGLSSEPVGTSAVQSPAPLPALRPPIWSRGSGGASTQGSRQPLPGCPWNCTINQWPCDGLDAGSGGGLTVLRVETCFLDGWLCLEVPLTEMAAAGVVGKKKGLVLFSSLSPSSGWGSSSLPDGGLPDRLQASLWRSLLPLLERRHSSIDGSGKRNWPFSPWSWLPCVSTSPPWEFTGEACGAPVLPVTRWGSRSNSGIP